MSIRKRTPRAGNLPVEIDDACLRAWPLPAPGDDADKEERGRLLVIAGSREIAGAALLSATAAFRAGAGKVLVATARSIAPSLSIAVPEARVVGLDETAAGGLVVGDALFKRSVDAMLIGPGLMDRQATVELVASAIEHAGDATVVLDALAMEIVRERPRAPHGRMLVTPHAGELAHLSGADKGAIEADPLAAARAACAQWRAGVVLKGATTIVAADDGRAWRHAGGNAGLAVSGSGDVLAGLIAGLAARRVPPEQAAVFGVALHARAGERRAAQVGDIGFLPREIAGEVPRLMQELASAAR